MKKFLALALVCVLALAMVACGTDSVETADTTKATTTAADASSDAETTEAPESEEPETEEPEADASVEDTDPRPIGEADTEKGEGVMTYEEYAEAEIDSEVVVETYVQAKQGHWTDDDGVSKATFYTQDADGAYFLYDMPCSAEEYDALVPGTKIKVTGYKAEWSGEVEIVDATFEILEGTYVAAPFDATGILASEDLILCQNQLASFKGMTVESVVYKNEEPGDDIYVTLGLDGTSYSFCVEVYLTGTDSDVYATVGELEVGDVVDVEGFLYWYEGVNPHITAIEVVG